MSASAFDLDDSDLAPVDDDDALADQEDLLAGPAGGVTLWYPEFDPGLFAEATMSLLEAFTPKKFDESKHPRWPKGTPRAGQFMRVGQSFVDKDGKRWQILSIVGSTVHAAEASGDVTKVEHKDFEATEKVPVAVAVAPVVKKLAAPKPISASWVKDPAGIPDGAQLQYGGQVLTKVSGGFRRESDGHVFEDTYFQKFNSLSGYEVIAKPGPPPKAKATGAMGLAVPKITVAGHKRLKGGAYSQDDDFPVDLPGGENTTVVSPYVRPETHDASIAKPSNSKLTAAEWSRFGDRDQRYYAELQQRFGAWSPSESKATMAQAWDHYDAAVKEVIKKALSNQYGPGYWGDEGGGRSLNLALLFSNKNSGKLLEGAWAKYENAKTAFDELNEVVHWDLYNRTRSPDITLFHGGGGVGYQSKYIGGKVPIYAGYSQSYSLDGAMGWGNHILATPVAIPYVAMSVYTPVPGFEHMSGEMEIAVGVRMKLDDHSVTFNTSDMGMSGGPASLEVRKWLQSKTKQQPAGGWIVDDLKDIWSGKSVIPIPEEPLVLTHALKGAGQESWTEPPASVVAEAKGMVKALKYKSEDGSKEAAVGVLDTMGLKSGDFIEGKQGARYLIVKDNSDPHGLRYVKLVSSSGQMVSDLSTSFPFSASQGNEFYRLDGHIDLPLPKPVKGWTPWTAAQYDALSKGEKKQLNKIPVDGLFTYDGEIYKILAAQSGGEVQVQSMQDGEKYYGNTLGVVVEMVPTAGFKLPSEYKPGDRVVFATADGQSTALGHVVSVDEDKESTQVTWALGKLEVPWAQLGPAPDSPGVTASNPAEFASKVAKGDKFAHDGKAYTVTTVLKSGTIKAKAVGGNVESFAPGDLLAQSVLWRPSSFAFGDKQKLKDLALGAVVSGSPSKPRPYLVEAKTTGGKVLLRNLETGETSMVSGAKSYPRLLTADEIQAQKEAVPPPESTKPSNSVFNIDDYVKGDHTTADQLNVGDKFLGAVSGAAYEIVGPSSKAGHKWQVKVLTDKFGGPGTLKDLISASGAIPLTAKVKAGFDHAKLKPGDKVTVGQLEPGDTFKVTSDTVYVVMAPGKVAEASPSGVLPAHTSTWGLDAVVTYAGKHYAQPKPPPSEVDPAKLPAAAINFYKWHKSGGGGYTYPKLKSMAVGTVFTDKDDKAWKVKLSGAGGVVVTDGKELFSADGDWRGKVSDGSVAFVDNAVLPGGDDTAGKVTVADLKPGDTFEVPPGFHGAGDTHQVTGGPKEYSGAGYWTVPTMNLSTGKPDKVGTALAPVNIMNIKEAVPEVASPASAAALDSIPVGATVKIGDAYVTRLPPKKFPGANWLIEQPGKPAITSLGATFAFHVATGVTSWPVGGVKLKNAQGVIAAIGSKVPDGVSASGPPGGPAVGQLLHEAFPAWGAVPVGTKFKAEHSPAIYTVTHDGKDVILTWQNPGKVTPSTSVKIRTQPIGYKSYVITELPGPSDTAPVAIKDLPEGAEFPNQTVHGKQLWKDIDSQATIKKVQHDAGTMMFNSPTHKSQVWSVAVNSPKGTMLVVPNAPSGVAQPGALPVYDPEQYVEGDTVALGDLAVGQFQKTANGIVWQVTGHHGAKVVIKQVTAQYGGPIMGDPTELSLSPDSMDKVLIPKPAVGSTGEVEAGLGQKVLPAQFSENTGKLTLNDLKVGDWYAYVKSPGSWDIKQVVNKNPLQANEGPGSPSTPSGGYVPPMIYKPDAAPTETKVLSPQSVKVGSKAKLSVLPAGTFFLNSFNKKYKITSNEGGEVAYVNTTGSTGPIETKVPHDEADAFGTFTVAEPDGPVKMKGTDLSPGDVFTISSPEGNAGAKFQFLSHAKGSEPAQVKVIHPGTGGLTTASVGDVIPWGGGYKTPDITVFKHDPVESHAGPVVQGPDPTAVVSPLQPYKYHKSGGGGYSYPKLGTLAPGTKFTDKTKTEYVVVGHQGNQTVFAAGDAQFQAPSTSFVHKLADPDVLSEGRLVYLTSGRVAVAA